MIDNSENWMKEAALEYKPGLYRYALYLLKSPEQAEDAVQDTFMTLCSVEQNDIRTNLKAWLYKVCRNHAFGKMRKDRKMTALCDTQLENTPDLRMTPDKRVEQKDQYKAMLDLVSELPEKHQELVRLKFQHKMSYKEMSDVAGVSVDNVGFILHTALKSLRQKMVKLENPTAANCGGVK